MTRVISVLFRKVSYLELCKYRGEIFPFLFRMDQDDAQQEMEAEQLEHERYSRMMENFNPGDYLIDDDDDENDSYGDQ